MAYLGRVLCPILIMTVNITSLTYNAAFTAVSLMVLIANGLLGFFIGMIIDKFIFSYKQLKRGKLELEQYKQSLQATTDAIGITDENGYFEFMNESQFKMYGYTSSELKNWKDCYSQETLDWIEEQVMPKFQLTGHWRGELEGVRKDGSTFPQEMSISKINETGKVIAVVRDITKLKESENLIQHIALHNDLTEIPNRRSMYDKLNELMEKEIPFSLFFIDLDRFKYINDMLGHNAGDQLLVETGRRLEGLQQDMLSVYHLGGDEFIVLSSKTSQREVQQLAMDISKQVSWPQLLNGNQIQITPSIGISRYPEDTDNKEELLQFADLAMYHGKQSGKNRFVLYNDSIKRCQERKLIIEQQLGNAIAEGELSLYFQPKYDMEAKCLVGLEALIRWESAVLGDVSPAEFIPIAEESTLIVDIGKWVINESLSRLSKWEDKGYRPVKLSVNISNRQLQEKQFVSFLRAMMEEFQVDPQYLELEITETITTEANIIPLLNAIKDLGVGLSIDDFGTGYSSLSVLNYLPIDTLKIDRSFVHHISSGKYGEEVIKSIIDIGRNMDLVVVAEGIETEEHFNLLRKLKCPIGQGYYFGKPVSYEEIEWKLKRIS
ncbi:sensor domain-containing protein [Sediminibacillus massiliensis]|uniref:sensor domain-containing protein n=1 Tax=Sediminibacillus massiliensis TaxID=1926277 RepID=UPI0009883D69|nr:EAL domain-containing protein [Sediminibacillus massiliensis]